MKKSIITIAFLLLLCNIALKAQSKQEYTDFQIYATTLYLKFYEATSAATNDFSQLNPDWIKQVKDYLKFMQDSADGVYIPEVTALGIEVIFQNSVEQEAWSSSEKINNMLKQYGLEIGVKSINYYFGGKNSIIYSSKKMLNWALIQNEITAALRIDAIMYNVYVIPMENPFWDYYEPQPCAGECVRKLFYWEKNRIVYGERTSGDSGLYSTDWSDIYDIAKGTLRRTKPSEPAYSFYEEWEPQLRCISFGILISRYFLFNRLF